MSRQQALQKIPSLESRNLEGAAVYYDAQVEFAERLVLENALSAVEHGATIKTYTRLDNFVANEKSIIEVQLVNQTTGQTKAARAAIVINAAGPWVDEFYKKAPLVSR